MSPNQLGWLQGSLGMLIFAGSLPATRIAVLDLAPMLLTSARAVIAGLLALLLLAVLRPPRPRRSEWPAVALTAVGGVIGFPLLTALALEIISATRALVYVGLLPLCTALWGQWRSGERPGTAFWLCAVIGSACVSGYALASGEPGHRLGDGLMVASILLCGMGYAEGANLTRRLGGWQVISWALVGALPLMALWLLLSWPTQPLAWSAGAIWSLLYVSVFSMLVGFIFWYRGLALGGIAAVGQLQLLQPFIGMALAALLLDESISADMLAAAAAAAVCVGAAKHMAARQR